MHNVFDMFCIQYYLCILKTYKSWPIIFYYRHVNFGEDLTKAKQNLKQDTMSVEFSTQGVHLAREALVKTGKIDAKFPKYQKLLLNNVNFTAID